MLDATCIYGKAVVIGAGIMGGGIAAQLANAGWQVRLLDLPDTGTERNRLAIAGRGRVRAARPPLLFLPELADNIQIGNIEDDAETMHDADWVVEAVAEKMEIKWATMAMIEEHVGAKTVISSNTSGLSLQEMTMRCSSEFKRRFLGTHFLNPPRYLKLLEVVAIPETDTELMKRFIAFAEQVLGHRVVQAKDTPGFISTRIWIQHLLKSIHVAKIHGLTVEEIDYLTGTLLGRPRSGTFRMADIVGLDTIASIASNQYERLPNDPFRNVLLLPEVIQRLIQSGRLGEKSGAGFYKRDKGEILVLDLETLDYRPRHDVRIDAVETLLKLPLADRFQAYRPTDSNYNSLWEGYIWDILISLTGYARSVGPEIADDVLAIDNVMQWGFGWEIGPFEIDDLLFRADEKRSFPIRRNYLFASHSAGDSSEILASPTDNSESISEAHMGHERLMRVFKTDAYQPVPSQPEYIDLAALEKSGAVVYAPVLSASGAATLIDMGHDVVCLAFHTKLNTFSPALCESVDNALEIAEQRFRALVIGNQSAHFSAGYDLKRLLDAAVAEDWQGIDGMLKQVQTTFLNLKYAKIPVVAAPHGYTLGAGCECVLHCGQVQSASELIMGLPELSAGVVPSGGAFAQLLQSAMAGWTALDDPYERVERLFDLIAFPKNSGSALEARKMGLLPNNTGISRNNDRLLYDAKRLALALADTGFTPVQRRKVWVGGANLLARLRMKLYMHFRAGGMSAHDRDIADRVAYILCGGELPAAQEVCEEYLSRLERESLIALIRNSLTLDRISHVLKTGKPLKN